MKEHKHHGVSNVPEVFSSFVGCSVKGVVHHGRATTLVFNCGWGLTFNHEHGSYWADDPREVQSLLYDAKKRLSQSKKELEGVLHLAGEDA